VEAVFQQNVLDGHLFLFLNKRRDRIKAMWWDRDGLSIFYKRLERGTFEMPRAGGDAPQLELDATELAMLLGGVSLAGVKRRKRFASRVDGLKAAHPASRKTFRFLLVFCAHAKPFLVCGHY
jgi:transposase